MPCLSPLFAAGTPPKLRDVFQELNLHFLSTKDVPAVLRDGHQILTPRQNEIFVFPPWTWTDRFAPKLWWRGIWLTPPMPTEPLHLWHTFNTLRRQRDAWWRVRGEGLRIDLQLRKERFRAILKVQEFLWLFLGAILPPKILCAEKRSFYIQK